MTRPGKSPQIAEALADLGWKGDGPVFGDTAAPAAAAAAAAAAEPRVRDQSFLSRNKTINTIHNKLQAFLQLLEFRIIGSASRAQSPGRAVGPLSQDSGPGMVQYLFLLGTLPVEESRRTKTKEVWLMHNL
jgi:hypothetical protein